MPPGWPEGLSDQIVPNRTRVAGAGYQSILATQFGVPSFAGRTSATKSVTGSAAIRGAGHPHGSMGVVYGTSTTRRIAACAQDLQERFASKRRKCAILAEEAATWVRLENIPLSPG